MNPTNKEFEAVSFQWIPLNEVAIPVVAEWLKKFGDLLPSPLSRRTDLDQYARKLQQFGDIGIAQVGGKAVGFVSLYANDRENLQAHLTMLVVLPKYQSKGIAKTILSRAFALARRRGMRRFWLHVDADNMRARRAYEAVGMRVARQVPPKLEMEVVFEDVERDPLSVVTRIDSALRLASAFRLDIDLRLKRDDLYPLPGGGIKARKIQWIWQDVIAGEHDVVVTTGGPQSNHARAAAVIAAQTGIRCHLVVVLEPGRNYLETGNILLMRMSGAVIEYCCKEEISDRMDAAMARYQRSGHNPLYIWGGGHCRSGTRAFVEAAKEAQSQCGDWVPDYVLHASGTGTTQAGLALGYADSRTRVIGISVARCREQGAEVARKCVSEFREHYGSGFPDVKIDFRDQWTAGGYEKTNERLLQIIRTAGTVGVLVDPTYSGKGLHGLVDLVKGGEISPGSKVLFWHTGGLMNLQAAEFAGSLIRI